MRRIIKVCLAFGILPFLTGCNQMGGDAYSPSNEDGTKAYTYDWSGGENNASDVPGADQLAFADDGTGEQSKQSRRQGGEDGKLKGGEPDSNGSKTPLKIIREAEIGIRVDDYRKARAEVAGFLKEFEAYIANENERKSRYYIENTIIIRLPSRHFDTFVDKVGGIANKVDYKRIKAMDVTKQYVDIESRLKTKKETRDKYNQFLKNAKNVEEMLAIEEKVRLLTEEIEAKEAELRYLSDRVSFSTITLDISQPLDYQYEEPRYAEPGFGQRMGKAFSNGWKGVLSFVVGLASIWPLLLFLLGVFLLVFRLVRKNSPKGGNKVK